jgi:hypothetical protein
VYGLRCPVTQEERVQVRVLVVVVVVVVVVHGKG